MLLNRVGKTALDLFAKKVVTHGLLRVVGGRRDAQRIQQLLNCN